jgi:hypothetical protein
MSAQGDLEEYREGLTASARDRGLQLAERGDPQGFRIAIDAIRDRVAMGENVTSDDIRPAIVVASNAVGAAFSFLARRGEIVCVGYRPSRLASRKTGLVRVWRGAWAA